MPTVGRRPHVPITGGADAAKFAINGTTGALLVRRGAGLRGTGWRRSTNVYNVIVSATDGIVADTQAITVNVTNVNDLAPVITSSAADEIGERDRRSGRDSNRSGPPDHELRLQHHRWRGRGEVHHQPARPARCRS